MARGNQRDKAQAKNLAKQQAVKTKNTKSGAQNMAAYEDSNAIIRRKQVEAEAKKLLAQQEALEAVRKAKELEIKAKHERAQQKAALALAAASPAVKGPVDGPVQPAQASDDAVADSAPAPADADAATATTETGLQDLSLSDKGAGAAEAETGTDTIREDATA